MAPLLSCYQISKRYGSRPVFEKLSFVVQEKERLGLIGPNGAGKSTLLKILAGRETPDEGEVAPRRGLKFAYVPQTEQFAAGLSVWQVVLAAAQVLPMTEEEREVRAARAISQVGFLDQDLQASQLSGGWRKRLAIAAAIVQDPELLLLDEPTNHLDTDGIVWLERLLEAAPFASIMVSHDRYFLDSVATRVAEIDRIYPQGIILVEGGYADFLAEKDAYLAAEAKRRDALAVQVRTELAWLARRPKARTTKAKDRIGRAADLQAALADVESRAAKRKLAIDFSASDRQTKRLVSLEKVGITRSGRKLFSDLDAVLSPGSCLGVVGPNGSGKSSLLQIVSGALEPDTGVVKRADQLRIVFFDQHRQQVDPSLSLKRALATEGDSVIYQDRIIHVAAWAKRFLFQADQLEQRVGSLSGGEQARVLIAQLMLQPADLLILDEPTNDIDIPTLEVLEEALLEFPGAILLVTHDRFLLDRVSTTVAGLDGEGRSGLFADYTQYEGWRADLKKEARSMKQAATAGSGSVAPKKKLSYKESREHEGLEARIQETEARHQQTLLELEAAATSGEIARLRALDEQASRLKEEVNQLYERWAELEAKLA